MKRSFLILASVVILSIMFCACTKAEARSDIANLKPTEATQQATEKATEKLTEKVTEKPTQPPTEQETTPTQPPTDAVKRNSNTDELITDFEYISKKRNSALSYKDCSYDDIVTCYIKNDTNSQNMHYIVDLKNGKIYSAKSPNRWYAVEDYPCVKDLTIQEIKDIKNAIKNANTQGWQAKETGNNANCNRLSTIQLEYKNGAVEEHSVACCGCGTIEGYKSIVKLIAQLSGNNQCSRCGKVHQVCNNCGRVHEVCNRCGKVHTACSNHQVCNTHNGCGCHTHHHHHHHHHYTTVYCYEYTYC